MGIYIIGISAWLSIVVRALLCCSRIFAGSILQGRNVVCVYMLYKRRHPPRPALVLVSLGARTKCPLIAADEAKE